MAIVAPATDGGTGGYLHEKGSPTRAKPVMARLCHDRDRAYKQAAAWDNLGLPTHSPRRMVPTLPHSPHIPRLLLTVASLVLQHVPSISSNSDLRPHVKRAEHHDATFVVFACLIPFLVLLSGVFAGLTLGYMSLDETQLNVLSISGTP